MEYKCFNCEEMLEIPELTTSPEEDLICYNCNTYLHLDIYFECRSCHYFYYKDYQECPYCKRSKSDEIEINALNYLYVKTETDYEMAIEFIRTGLILGLDTEGNSLDPFKNELMLVQIGNEEEVYIFDYNCFSNLR